MSRHWLSEAFTADVEAAEQRKAKQWEAEQKAAERRELVDAFTEALSAAGANYGNYGQDGHYR
jgi:hypothetical protein